MQFSIYTSCFNIVKNDFNYWKNTIPKWVKFLNNGEYGEIVIAVNQSEDNTLDIIKSFISSYNCVRAIETNFDYSDLAFDGKIKNEALQACKNSICIGLDLDEIPCAGIDGWIFFADFLSKSHYDALFIPVIDLCKSEKTAKSIGQKWYLHKKDGLKRGVWQHAKLKNGHIDISKSDTCELISDMGNLALAATICHPLTAEEIKRKDCIFIAHFGHLLWENRIKQNLTWKPTWENRAGHEVTDIILEKEKFENIPVFEHNLNIDEN